MGWEGALRGFPPSAFKFNYAAGVCLLVERLILHEGGVSVGEEHLPAFGVEGGDEAGPAPVCVVSKLDALVSPAGEDVAGVDFVVAGLFRGRSQSTGVGNPLAKHEGGVGRQQLVHIAQKFHHFGGNLSGSGHVLCFPGD